MLFGPSGHIRGKSGHSSSTEAQRIISIPQTRLTAFVEICQSHGFAPNPSGLIFNQRPDATFCILVDITAQCGLHVHLKPIQLS